MLGDLIPFPLLLLLFVGLVALYLIERYRHREALKRVPLRIHVNGTRGKSSVTRLIAAGLRAGGKRTFAKTTGSAPRFIHPDGSEEPILRRARGNIREQITTLIKAAGEGCEALVVECMAIRPDLQRICERKMVRSTHGVITNIRADHLDVMGPTLEHVAMALAMTVPRNGRLFSCSSRFDGYLAAEAARRGSTYHPTRLDRHPTPEEMRGFDYIEIPENVGLALDVCENVGVDRATALRGMYKVTPDIGAATRHVLKRDGKEIDFYNVFAANDQQSTAMVWKLIGLHEPGEHSTIVLISNRGDRLRRAVDMADTIAQDVKADWYVVAGDHPDMFVRLAARRGVPRNKLVVVGQAEPGSVLDRLFEMTPRRAAVMGIGNIGGFGMKFMQILDKERTGHAS